MLQQQVMEVVTVTMGTFQHANLQSNQHSIFKGQLLVLQPNQQCQGNKRSIRILLFSSLQYQQFTEHENICTAKLVLE